MSPEAQPKDLNFHTSVLTASRDSKPSSLSPCVILLNGFPGVGKFTIAKTLKSTLGTAPHRLIDNHRLIDLVQAIEPARNEAHYELRKKIRQVTFDGIKRLTGGLVIIMTACLSHTEDNIEQFHEYLDIAEARGVPLVIVNIVCEEKENERRLCSGERREEIGGKGKLIDIGVLERLRREYTQLDPGKLKFEWRGFEYFHCELDTTKLSVEEATERVLDFLRVCLDC